MRMRSKIALVFAVVTLLSLVGWSSNAQRSRTTWEYKLVAVHGFHELPPPDLTRFNDLGSEGWELVMVLPEEVQRANTRQIKVVYYFKRRV